MKILYILFFVYFLPVQISYKDAFRSDFRNALNYIKQNKIEIEKSCRQYKNNPSFVLSIVFPEIIRYSYFKDFFETAALELLYTEYGSDYADFSIGRFQIKPSFAEETEAYVLNNLCLSEKYKFLTVYSQTKVKEIRQARIARLKTLKWQLIYANCLLDIVDDKFKNEIFSDEQQKILFYATAYNHGFVNTAENIRKWEQVKTFPYGAMNDDNSFSYAAIASDFYFNVSAEVLKTTDQKVLTNK